MRFNGRNPVEPGSKLTFLCHVRKRGNSLETPNVWGLSSFHPNVSKQPPPPQCLGFCLLFTPRLLSRRAGSDVDATAAAHRTRKPCRCHVITGQNKDFSSLKGECHSHLPPTVDYFLFLELYSRRVSAEGSGGERERWPRGNRPAARGSGGREIEIYAALFLTFLSHLSTRFRSPCSGPLSLSNFFFSLSVSFFDVLAVSPFPSSSSHFFLFRYFHSRYPSVSLFFPFVIPLLALPLTLFLIFDILFHQSCRASTLGWE